MERGIEKRARGINRLTDAKVRAFLKAAQPGRKLFDGDGLFLTITPAGTAVWRLKCYLPGSGGEKSTERLFSIGKLSDVTLSNARAERTRIRNLIRKGVDPVQERQQRLAVAADARSTTFEVVARDWLKRHKAKWSAVHYTKTEQALERDVFPHLGRRPIGAIESPEITAVIEKILARGVVDTAAKVLQNITKIFALAQARGQYASGANPADCVREVLRSHKPAAGEHPALLEWDQLGDVLRRAEIARLSPAVRMAHRLCAFSAARISNVVTAEWSEFDLDGDAPVWTIPRAKMKARDRKHPHKVYLGPTIAVELRAWRDKVGGNGYVFPSPERGKDNAPISRESIEKAYRQTLDLRDKHTPHGWRSAFSTLVNESKNDFEPVAVELALDHVRDDEVVRAYDRGLRLEQRVRMMRWWDEHLTAAQRGETIDDAREAQPA